MRGARFCGALALGALTVLCPVYAFAEPTATELAVARRLFTEAVELEHDGRWELAASKLRDALVIKDTPGLRFHLAHCEEKRGRLVEAMLNYDRARELIAAGAKAPDVESVLEPARAQLERRLPQLVIVARADIPGLVVELDGQAVAHSVLGRAAPVDVGSHRILARAPGYRDHVQEVPFAEGERRTVQLDLVPIPAPPAAATEPKSAVQAGKQDEASADSSARTYVLLAESAVAVAGLGVGIGYWLSKDAAADRIERAQTAVDESTGNGESCARPGPELAPICDELDDAISAHDRARTYSVVGFTVASVGAAATVITYLAWPSSKVAPSASIGRDGSWFGLRGRF